MYDIGEEGLDRLARCFNEEEEETTSGSSSSSRKKRASLSAAANVLPLLAEAIKPFLAKEQWIFRFVALMSISQTVEYIPSNEDQQLAAVADTISKVWRSPCCCCCCGCCCCCCCCGVSCLCWLLCIFFPQSLCGDCLPSATSPPLCPLPCLLPVLAAVCCVSSSGSVFLSRLQYRQQQEGVFLSAAADVYLGYL